MQNNFQLDLTDLQNDVIDHWEDNDIEYFEFDVEEAWGGIAFISNIKPEFMLILNDPLLCISELGYTKISEYLRETKMLEDEQKEFEQEKTISNYANAMGELMAQINGR